VKFICLVGAICYVLTEALPKRLFWYFVWQLVYTLAVFTTASFIFPDTSWQYALVFSIFTVPILWCVVRLTLEALEAHKARWLALATGILAAYALGWLAYRGLAKPMAYYDWIALAEGAVVSFAGVSSGLALPYVARKRVLGVLATLWLAQSVWQFGFPLHIHSEAWLRLNWYIPSTLCVVAFLAIGTMSSGKISK
jgi:hypothetical protein